jgi:RND family efflux transporter MFP subunit
LSTDPIRFEFSFDEASYLRLVRINEGGAAGRAMSAPVMLKLIDEPKFLHKGTMDFLDNVIDRSSGTIRGRAQFANPDNIFAPGMFARIELASSAPYEALLVPDAAIGTEQARKYVLVVGDGNVAAAKYVTLGQVIDGMRVIKSGLAATDAVIVEGLMRARPGQKVTPQEAAARPPISRTTAN